MQGQPELAPRGSALVVGCGWSCLDGRPLEQAGARWVNGVAQWLLDAAEIPQPTGDELHGEDGPFHLIAG